MPRAGSWNFETREYRAFRKLMKSRGDFCWRCGVRPGESVQHTPPRSMASSHAEWVEMGGELEWWCGKCNYGQSARMMNETMRRRRMRPHRQRQSRRW